MDLFVNDILCLSNFVSAEINLFDGKSLDLVYHKESHVVPNPLDIVIYKVLYISRIDMYQIDLFVEKLCD